MLVDLPCGTCELDSPRSDQVLGGDDFELRGRVGAEVSGVILVRGGEPALRVPVEGGRFSTRVPLGRSRNGVLALELWGEDAGGRRTRLVERVVRVRRLALGGVHVAELVGGAARKAWLAWREGRLPASPRHWLRNLRMHYGELQAHAPANDPLVAARAATVERATGSLDAFLAGDERLVFQRPAAPEVSVVIPIYNRAELLLRALRSIPARDDLELVLVDDASSDRTPELLARIDGAVCVRHAENRGFLDSANAGAAAARGRVLLHLNSDIELHPGSLEAGLRALSAGVGAVGGRLILPDGRLQEAGSVIFGDGSCEGYGRGDRADAPAYDFRRDVDFCSAACLLTPRASFEALGGFDAAFRPAYYEDVDYCVRLWQRGLRVVYEPALIASHVEFASSASPAKAIALQTERRARFVARHAAFVAGQPPRAAGTLHACDRRRGLRILYLDDRAPVARHGSGHPRAAQLVQALAAAGHLVTVYATTFPGDTRAALGGALPDVELETLRGERGLAGFLTGRAGYYDRIVVSRPHNLRLLRQRLGAGAHPPIVYDAEALVAPREQARRALRGEPPAPAQALTEELALAAGADVVLAVSAPEAQAFRAAGARRVVQLGHALPLTPTPRPFAAREGLLFVGALYEDDSPNADALEWFVQTAWPRVRALVGPIWLTVAGARPPRRLLAHARPGAGIEILGAVDDLTPLYDRARLFVAPTRFAGGLPHKIHEAAAFGLPVVCTPLLAGQLGWQDGVELSVADGDGFAARVAGLYQDPAAWQAQRDAALARVAADCAPDAFAAALAEALR